MWKVLLGRLAITGQKKKERDSVAKLWDYEQIV
jgi:hypothetical protein